MVSYQNNLDKFFIRHPLLAQQTADDSLTRHKQSITIGTSNTSVERRVSVGGWDICGGVMMIGSCSIGLILRWFYSSSMLASQNTDHRLLQRWEESNLSKLAAQTRHRLEKHYVNLFGCQISQDIHIYTIPCVFNSLQQRWGWSLWVSVNVNLKLVSVGVPVGARFLPCSNGKANINLKGDVSSMGLVHR